MPRGIRNQAPRCAQCRVDCFAFAEGRCRILSKTEFGDRFCPFFKKNKITVGGDGPIEFRSGDGSKWGYIK